MPKCRTDLKHKNVAAELFAKLLKDELKNQRNAIWSNHRTFQRETQEHSTPTTIAVFATQEVIDELIKLAKEMEAATKRGVDLGLTDDEVAFYDALAVNESAVQAMGDAQLKVIAAELITQVRKSVTIDWTFRECPRQNPRDGPTHTQPLRLSARFTGGCR